MSTLSEEVRQIEDRMNDLDYLCRQILATINLPRNMEQFHSGLGGNPTFQECIDGWQSRLDSIRKSTARKPGAVVLKAGEAASND